MGFISGSGTGFVARTAAWAPLPLLAIAAALLLTPSPASAAELNVRLQGLRSARGLVHLCLTRHRDHFPDCAGDPTAVKRSLSASAAGTFSVQLSPGDYALSVVHDENGNGKFDTTFLGLPKEGFAFSNDAQPGLASPSFQAAAFEVGHGPATASMHVQYWASSR